MSDNFQAWRILSWSAGAARHPQVSQQAGHCHLDLARARSVSILAREL